MPKAQLDCTLELDELLHYSFKESVNGDCFCVVVVDKRYQPGVLINN
jgi:hypothetical protein